MASELGSTSIAVFCHKTIVLRQCLCCNHSGDLLSGPVMRSAQKRRDHSASTTTPPAKGLSKADSHASRNLALCRVCHRLQLLAPADRRTSADVVSRPLAGGAGHQT